MDDERAASRSTPSVRVAVRSWTARVAAVRHPAPLPEVPVPVHPSLTRPTTPSQAAPSQAAPSQAAPSPTTPSQAAPSRPTAGGSVPRLLLRLLAGVLVLLPLLGLAALAEAAGPGLTRDQERVVLRLVDDICADTWCSGDDDYRFQRLRCTGRACALRFSVAVRTEGRPQWRPRRGRLPALTYADMVTTWPTGTRTLTPRFFELVGDAVRGARLPAAGGPACCQ